MVATVDTTQRSVSELIVDGHVHYYPCFDELTFLKAAVRNLGTHGKGLPTLFMTEGAGADTFSRWASGDCPWSVKRCGDPNALLLNDALLVIAGRQVVSAERVELLAIGTTQAITDGLPLDASLQAVLQAGAIPVLPWGVGKWLGKRGQLVKSLADEKSDKIFLGDIAGRPFFWPAPKQFDTHPTLPGSDPLPLASDAEIVGTYGFRLSGEFELDAPVASIKQHLYKPESVVYTLGKKAGLFTFLRQQIGLRLKK